jgi:hypothetical protein
VRVTIDGMPSAAFLAGAGLGVFVAAQVGPISLLCARTALRGRFAAALAVGLGAATSDLLYACLVVRATGMVLLGRRLSDGALRPADVLAGLGMVGFGGLLAVRTAQGS